MRWYLTILMLLIMDPAVRLSEGTCVLDSDFGFALNCRFKKSGLFRVRNLGGVKGYVGLGFSVGDELGFPDSLSNTDTSKRRSVAAARSANIASISSNQRVDAAHPAPVLRQGVTVPPFKPIPPSSGAPSGGSRYQHLLVGPVSAAHNISSGHSGMHAVAAPALAALGVPPFQALPPSITRVPNGPAQAQMVGVQIIKAPAVFRESLQAATNHFQVRKDTNPVVDPGLSTNTLSLRTLPGAPIDTPAQKNSLLSTSSLSKLENKPLSTVLMNHSIKMLAKASNLSEEAITAAIAIRQQQLLLQQQRQELALAAAATTTTTTTTTRRPATAANVINKYPMADVSKVMNAPKEYYPLGYDKNFDDKFASRVSLPDTSFYCGDQKHFPGLYADEDLGCMVFHVCAFTDDGLIMKSFLCPESTLFDQTILKCNWWFYVDCKASRKLYDSNLPISKSYQLMKALAFFSSYNKSWSCSCGMDQLRDHR